MADQRLGLETSGQVGTSRREKMEWKQDGWKKQSLLISRTIQVTITTNNMVRAALSTGRICRWENAIFGPTSQHRLTTTCNYITSFEVCVCIYMVPSSVSPPPPSPPPMGWVPRYHPPFPSICKLLAAFLRSSFVFARSLQHFWLSASHLLGTCYLLGDLRSTYTPSKYLCDAYVLPIVIYTYTCAMYLLPIYYLCTLTTLHVFNIYRTYHTFQWCHAYHTYHTYHTYHIYHTYAT